MKSIRFFQGVATALLLMTCSWLDALNWPVTPEPELHQQSNAAIAVIIRDFPGTPAATLAEKVQSADATQPKYGWIGESIQLAEQLLLQYPPSTEHQAIRRAALLLMDYPLHVNNKDEAAPQALKDAWQQAVDRLHEHAMNRVFSELQNSKPEVGELAVWKLYNMGFIVKSANHTIGFDLWPGAISTQLYTPEQLKTLVSELDLLLISHEHRDHFSTQLVQAMLQAGKPVIAPDGAKLLPKEKELTRIYGPNAAFRHQEIKVLAFPGFQGSTRNNIYLVEIDGLTVSHNGDNTDQTAYAPLQEQRPVDLLLANCWSGFSGYFAATRPARVVTAHENELSHRVQNRESFRETFERLGNVASMPDVSVIDCGEGLIYRRGH